MQSVSIDNLAEQSEMIAAELRAGHTLKLLQGGKRIAEIVPASVEVAENNFLSAKSRNDKDRQAAIDHLKALLNKGLDLGGYSITDRSELYERD
jgi:antitoxin (DNA-binding transcriptional repressor) of toxin-antitoxin stability system